MMTRLTFAVATCFAPEILLMDEWIMAGDAAFLTKASTVFSHLSQKRACGLGVPQPRDMPSVLQPRDLVDQGQIKAAGPIEEILNDYTRRLGTTGTNFPTRFNVSLARAYKDTARSRSKRRASSASGAAPLFPAEAASRRDITPVVAEKPTDG